MKDVVENQDGVKPTTQPRSGWAWKLERRPRVVSADDHEAVLDQGARELGDDIEWVAKVGDGAALVEAANTFRAGLVIVGNFHALG